MDSVMPAEPVRIPTGRNWAPSAIGYAFVTIGFGAFVFWLASHGSYAETSAGLVSPLLATGVMAALMSVLAASAWRASKSAVYVDPGTEQVLVRLGTTDCRLGLRDVVAVAVMLDERDMPQPRPGPGLLSLVVVAVFLLLPKTQKAYVAVLRRGDGRPPVPILPWRGKTIAHVLPVATQVSQALQCPLETPGDAAHGSNRTTGWRPRPLHPME